MEKSKSIKDMIDNPEISIERGEPLRIFYCSICGIPYHDRDNMLACERKGEFKPFLYDIGDFVEVKDIKEAGWYKGKTVKIVGKFRFLPTHGNMFITEPGPEEKDSYLHEEQIEKKFISRFAYIDGEIVLLH